MSKIYSTVEDYLTTKKLLTCNNQSKNLTFVGILLSGPSAEIPEYLETYYNFYNSNDPTETNAHSFDQDSSWQLQQKAIEIHLQFMMEVLNTIIFNENQLDDALCTSIKIIYLAIIKASPGGGFNNLNNNLKCNPRDQIPSFNMLEFLFHFFHQFNVFFQSVISQDQQYRESSLVRKFPLESKRASLLWQQMKVLSQFHNPLLESIPSDGLWCTKYLHSFYDWFNQSNQNNWYIGNQSDNVNNNIMQVNKNEIQKEIRRSQQLILLYFYQKFLQDLCHLFPIGQCIQLFESQQSTLSSLENIYYMPNISLAERLNSLDQFKKIIFSRLHQLDQEAQAQHKSLDAYLVNLYEKGKADRFAQHNEKYVSSFQNLKECISTNPVTNKSNNLNSTKNIHVCWDSKIQKNQEIWKQFNNNQFAYDFESDLIQKDFNQWNAF